MYMEIITVGDNKLLQSRILLRVLFTSWKSFLEVLWYTFFTIVVFSILGVQLWRGSLSFCSNPSKDIKSRSDCLNSGTFLKQEHTNDGKEINVKYNSEWVTPLNNYDNVFESTLTFFGTSTLEMWPNSMFRVVDSMREDKVLKEETNPLAYFVFIAFIMFIAFFWLNVLVSIIVQLHREQLQMYEGSDCFTPEEKEWIKMNWQMA